MLNEKFAHDIDEAKYIMGHLTQSKHIIVGLKKYKNGILVLYK